MAVSIPFSDDYAPYGKYQPGLGKKTSDRQYGEKASADEKDIIYEACRTYETWLQAWDDARQKTKEAFRYAEGEPWTPEKEAALISAGMPALKINKIWPRLLRVMGQEGQVRKKIQAVPRKAQTEDGSILANDIFDWIEWLCKMQDQFSYAFLHSLIGQLGGWVECYWDTRRDPLGAPLIRTENPFSILDDPSVDITDIHRKNAMIKSYMAHVDDIIRQYPEQGDKIRKQLAESKDYTFRERLSSWFTRILGSAAADFDDLMNEREGFYRLIEYQKREQVHIYKARNWHTGREAEIESRRDELLLRQAGFEIVDKYEDRIRTIVTCADLFVLEDARNEVQNGMFSIFPVAGFVMLGRSEGAVRQWQGPIDEIVKSRSAFLHLLTSNAASGWQVPKGSLDADEKQKLNRHGSSPNYVQEYDPEYGKPQRIQQSFPPAGEIDRFNLASLDLNEISSLDRGELGLDEKNQSGVLHRQKIAQAMLSYEPFLKNLNATKELVGEYLLDFFRLKMESLPSGERTISAPRSGMNNEIDRFENIVVQAEDFHDEYAIVTKTGFDTEMQRYKILMAMSEVEQNMPAELVPYHLKVELTDWPEKLKKEYADYIKSRMGLPEQEQREIANDLANIRHNFRMTDQGAAAESVPMPQQN